MSGTMPKQNLQPNMPPGESPFMRHGPPPHAPPPPRSYGAPPQSPQNYSYEEVRDPNCDHLAPKISQPMRFGPGGDSPGNALKGAISPKSPSEAVGPHHSNLAPGLNGPYTSPSPMVNANYVPDQRMNVNGVNGTSAEHLGPTVTLSQWSSPGGIPASRLPTSFPQFADSSPIASQPTPTRNQYPSPQIGSKTVPDTSTVPSAGLPLPYGSYKASSPSPQVTPGASQPPSARSSRNPSPISTQRYDFMEGQFSNKPSPSSSSTNLLGMSQNSVNQAQYTPNYVATQQPNSSSQFPVTPVGHTLSATPSIGHTLSATPSIGHTLPATPSIGHTLSATPSAGHTLSATPTAMPFSNVSPMISHPLASQSMPPVSGISPGVPRQRYPQQVGYNQSNFQSPRPAVASQPSSLQPSPMYMSTQRTSPQYPHQGGIVESPVGDAPGYDPGMHAKMAGMSVQSGFSKLWGNETVNLLQDRNILPALPLEPPKPVLPSDRPNCSTKIFRSTLTNVPETSALLGKSRLPFGILIHPFRDISSLSVIQCNTIVRCRNCRAYINPFATFIDQHRWQCNLCFRTNELPEEFLYDPITRSYGDPSRRPEIKNGTIEFIAPSDYMLRPPQPAVYLFVLDVSHGACEIGYLDIFCKALLDHLDDLPGDTRTKVGFITFDGSIHFYNLAEGLNQPHMLTVSDVDDVFLPSPDNLLVNVAESKALIRDLLEDLPKRFEANWSSSNCLGAALQVAYKLMSPIGGRITVVQSNLPNCGPGNLKNREDPNQRASKDVTNLGPANDFYKKLALECSSQQIAVDLFLLCSQYTDISTISCISKYSSGCIQYYPGFHRQTNIAQAVRFSGELKRYLTRRIGFEAVMRIRCTKGIAIHTFHGNFFVRSTDLLSLPNVNPDIGFGMQISIDENLSDCNTVCFQAAVLYTSTNGERRIRVHTMCLPVVSVLTEVWAGADQEAIIGLVSKMAVDRSIASSLSDARDALINVAVDLLGAFKLTQQSLHTSGALMAPYSTRLIPLFILGLLKHMAFRCGISTKLDERVFAMEQMKTLPLAYLMKYIYPPMYPVHMLDDKNAIHQDDDAIIPQPVILQLSSEKVDRHGAYLLDTFDILYLYVGRAVNDYFCQNVFGVPTFSSIPEDLVSLPELNTPESERLRNFISWLQDQRPSHCPIRIIREDSPLRVIFLQYMLDDRTESLFSYYEFLQHLRQQVSK